MPTAQERKVAKVHSVPSTVMLPAPNTTTEEPINAPLTDCSNEEQRRVIQFLWAKTVRTSEICGRVRVWHVDCCMSHTYVHEWVETLKGGQTTTDDTWLGRSSTITCAEVKEQIDQYIQHNRKIDMYKTLYELNTNHGRRRCKSDYRVKRNILKERYNGRMEWYINCICVQIQNVSQVYELMQKRWFSALFYVLLPHWVKMHDKGSLEKGGTFQRYSSSLTILQSTRNNHNGISCKDDNYLTSWDRIVFQKLTVPQLLKTFPELH